MEIVDKLDNKRQLLNKTSERHENVDGEYRQSVHTWIQNSKGEFLISVFILNFLAKSSN